MLGSLATYMSFEFIIRVICEDVGRGRDSYIGTICMSKTL